MAPVKKEGRESIGLDDSAVEEPRLSWDELAARVSRIAQPLAPRKLTKKLYKVVKKAQNGKKLRKGVREVQKFVRKGERGMVILAGDTYPVDVITHMPVVCEESSIPYCYIPSKQDLGAACGSRRATCMVMVIVADEYKELYDECVNLVSSLPQPIHSTVKME